MGIADTMDSCSAVAFSTVSVFDITYTPSGSFYQSDLFGLAASVLSLATNMVATILIGCKAWCVMHCYYSLFRLIDLSDAREHAKIMGSVSSLKRSSRVEKILIFLVESGTVYCIIWVSYAPRSVTIRSVRFALFNRELL